MKLPYFHRINLSIWFSPSEPEVGAEAGNDQDRTLPQAPQGFNGVVYFVARADHS